jgi:hypothetical protein
MSSFVQQFGFQGEREPPEEHAQPVWIGPPEAELGVATPLNLVVARSERGVVALTQSTSFTTGLTLSFLAQARGLDGRTMHMLFHEQHAFGPGDEDLPEGFLRLGVELPGGARASNIGGRRRPFADGDPEGPVFTHRGGHSGQGGSDRVTMHHDYWLWPLPEPGTIRVSCEWPLVEIPLSTVEVDGSAIVAAAAQVLPLWPPA